MEVYAVPTTEMGKKAWLAYERHPVPGGVDQPIVCRKEWHTAITDGFAFLKTQGGSLYKAERSVVGA